MTNDNLYDRIFATSIGHNLHNMIKWSKKKLESKLVDELIQGLSNYATL